MSRAPAPPSPSELKAFRARYRMSQAALAVWIGSSSRTIEDWEAGRREPPAMLELALAAIAAGLSPWRSAPLQITHDGDGYRVRYQPAEGPHWTGEHIWNHAFKTQSDAEAFARYWEGTSMAWFGMRARTWDEAAQDEMRALSGASLVERQS